MLKDSVLTPGERVQVAALAQCDPKTVQRYAEGHPTRPTLNGRITAALRSLGWLERVARPVAVDSAPAKVA